MKCKVCNGTGKMLSRAEANRKFDAEFKQQMKSLRAFQKALKANFGDGGK